MSTVAAPMGKGQRNYDAAGGLGKRLNPGGMGKGWLVPLRVDRLTPSAWLTNCPLGTCESMCRNASPPGSPIKPECTPHYEKTGNAEKWEILESTR